MTLSQKTDEAQCSQVGQHYPQQTSHATLPITPATCCKNTGYDQPAPHAPPLPNPSAMSNSSPRAAASTPPGPGPYQRPLRGPVRLDDRYIKACPNGKLAFNCPVSEQVLEKCHLKSEDEFTYMRYTAATCDPNDFMKDGFTLRQVLYERPRRTELFIVITMYNEETKLFCRTMHGVMKNIMYLCTQKRSRTWGDDGWKKVVVCIVSDGRKKIQPQTLSVLATLGAYQDGVEENVVSNEPIEAHIYEYTTQISIKPNMRIQRRNMGIVPVQILFCLKENNQKKINSHRWAFNAFGPILKPDVCVLLDVGTQPGPMSIYHLWKAFDNNSNVGGACGEIVALKGKCGLKLLNPLVAAQNFEYKISNILDKPLESIFGYITVLPGAFSAYRYIALQNNYRGEGPLQEYFLAEKPLQEFFLGEKPPTSVRDVFKANMYLAEDRILHYVKSAYAVTDVPDQVPELISQRRRWLNGSFFVAIYSIFHFRYIYRSSHTVIRKFWIHVEMLYQLFNLVFSWFALANYYIVFKVLTDAMEDKSLNLKGAHIGNVIINNIFLGLLITSFILALGNRPQGFTRAYMVAFIGYAIVTVYMTITAVILAKISIKNVIQEAHNGITLSDFATNSILRNIVISSLATIGLYLISSLLSCDLWHMITSILQYLLIAPSYIAVLNVYAFANVHDTTWGTKGVNEPDIEPETTKTESESELKRSPEQKKNDYYQSFRTMVLLCWTLSNGLLAGVVLYFTGKASDRGASKTVNGYMAFILFSIAGLALFRFCGSVAYLIVRTFPGKPNPKKDSTTEAPGKNSHGDSPAGSWRENRRSTLMMEEGRRGQ